MENISTPCATPAGHATGEVYVITNIIIYHEVDKKTFQSQDVENSDDDYVKRTMITLIRLMMIMLSMTRVKMWKILMIIS